MEKFFLQSAFFLIICFFSTSAFAGTAIWEVNSPSDGVFFSGADCNVATQTFCPAEMGWEGNTVYYIFDFPSDAALTQKLDLEFNVVFSNYGVSQDVLLEIKAGKNKSSLQTIKTSLDINRLGKFVVSIDSNFFQKGTKNYLKFFGTNISPIGYGTNPPNFKINYIALKNSGGMGPAPAITDAELLDKTESQAAKYFFEQALPNGLVKDAVTSSWSSIAATGFGLAVFTVMAGRNGTNANWTYTPAQLRKRTNQILDSLISIQENQATDEANYGTHGLFYHFINADNKAAYESEVSTIDTAILFAGIITAGEYFGGEVKQKANQIVSTADWNYFLKTPENNFSTNNSINYQFSHGWKSGSRFSQPWDRPSDETLLVSIIALASNPENTDFQKSFFSWPRVKRSYSGYEIVNSYFGSLFTYEFAHAFVDFEKIGADKPEQIMPGVSAVDWWQNSINAIKASRQFAIANSAAYSTYGIDSWGLSAVQKPNGNYEGKYGALPTDSGNAVQDGTIAPYSSISSMPFFKSEDAGALQNNKGFRTLKNYYDNYYWELFGNYGPKDSFNDKNEFSKAYLGIDQGPIVLMIENYRTGFVWEQFLKNKNIKAGLRKVFECPDGICEPAQITCHQNSDCGTDGYTGNQFCQNGNVFQDYQTFNCNNPGTTQASCSSTTTPQQKQACTNGCSNGTCNSQTDTNCKDSIPLYRFWNSNNNDHFYTTSEAEKTMLQTTHKEWNYIFEGTATYVYQTQKTGTVPLYRFWNSGNLLHFYTTSETEKNRLQTTQKGWNYIFEGITGYIYQTQQTNTLPLHRFWNTQKNDHFYTTSENEKTMLQTTHKEWNYSYEGITGYACKSQAN